MRKGYTIALLALLVLGVHGQARAECITADAWVAGITSRSPGVQIIRIADVSGLEAKAVLVRLNKTSTANLEADRIIFLGGEIAATGEPEPYVFVATFLNGCGVKVSKLPPALVVYVLGGGDA